MNWYNLEQQEDGQEYPLEIGDILEVEEGMFMIVTGFENEEIKGICVLNISHYGLEETINMLLESILEAEEEREKEIYKSMLTYIQNKYN